MVEAKLLRKKLKNGLIVDKWDLVTIIEKQQAEIEHLKELFGCDPAYFEPDKKAKTLTDEEITQVFDECYPNNADGDVVTLIDFARAILRKAQEK